LKFQAVQAANEILISPRQRGYYDAGRLEAGYDAAKPSPKTPRTPRQTKASRRSTAPRQTTAPHQPAAPQAAAPPQATARHQTTAPNETTAPRQTTTKPHTYQALREALRAASLQQNLAAQRTWLIQTFGFVESPRDSPIILKSLNARERTLLHLAVQSFGHNLYSKSVTVRNGERWTCVGNRYAVVSNMNLIRERNSREEQLEQEKRQRVHDKGCQTLVNA
jgi:type IV secretory pathway VirB10-like protein